MKVWSALPGRSVWPVGLPKATAASADGRWALGCISYGDLQVWDTASGRWREPFRPLEPALPGGFQPEQPVGGSRRRRIPSVGCGREHGAVGGRTLGGSNVMFVARFSPDGRWIASVDTGGVVSLWEGALLPPALVGRLRAAFLITGSPSARPPIASC
ncbi:MAG: hypothetical protein M5U12_12690 [Verrucomicrobia bacterium]|nr:hypothetical protein [Verrucomicrobiota bacterium]